jgi:hypothetical protein
MHSTRASVWRLAIATTLSLAPLVPAFAQELGVYAGGGVGGIRDVRRPFGGGVQATFLFHDWIGLRGSAGFYNTLEHRTAVDCRRGVGEATICNTLTLSSRSHFPQAEGLLMLRGHLPGKGIRVEAGVGPTWLNVTNEIRTRSDSIYSPSLSSSAAGVMFIGGMLVHPPWRFPVEVEGAYAYHMTGRFGACTNQPNDPLCDQRLHFHELRVSLLYRPRKAVR